MSSEWTNGKVLVTGAGGFIGSHLTERLLALGADVRVLVRHVSSGRLGLLEELSEEDRDRLEVVRGDLRDVESVRQACAGVDTVFHLGAEVSVPFSFEVPRSFLDTNLGGTLNVLEACRNHETRRLVLTSSSEVFGTAQRLPMDEEHPLHPQSPYAASKVAADALTLSYRAAHDLPLVTLRPFNAFGPRQSLRAVIPTVLVQALRGDRLQLGRTDPVRDWTYVSDVVEAFLAAARAEDDVLGEVFVTGTGRGHSIAELVQAAGRLVDRELVVETADERLRPGRSEVERLVADPRRAKERLGWEAQVSFEDGLRRTIEHLRERGDELDPSRHYR